MLKRFLVVPIVALLLVAGLVPPNSRAQGGGSAVYLPIIINRGSNEGISSNLQIANAPYFSDTDVMANKFHEMGIFWLGKVGANTNYSDVRVGYNNEALWVHVATVDRRLWYNSDSTGSDLERWDSVTLLLHLNEDTSPLKPETISYRFVTELDWGWEDASNYQAAYRGNGSQWVKRQISVPYMSGWRGEAPNDAFDDHGWTATFKIPYTSLGLSSKPASGTVWRFGLMVHDRDTEAGPALVDQVWPVGLDKESPATWGRIGFGLPEYNAPTVRNLKTTTIRNGLNGSVVTDADVGGWTTCGGNLEVWTEWGEKNYAGQERFNIQNQGDISEWPCFSKYYVNFPISSIPANKVIRSAKLVLYQFGGSDPYNAYSSLIQVLRVNEDWNEGTINWNNAPRVMENLSRTWVGVFDPARTDYCPGDAYQWDVSRAAALAYQQNEPLQLALYSADSPMHSGKYFYSSDTKDCSGVSRPTLIIEWGDPQ